MGSLRFTTHTSADGIVEREFTLDDVTGVLWSPEAVDAGAPLVLMGHSGGLSKRSPGIVARARHYITGYGFTVAALDAPGHGDRPRNERDRRWVAEMLAARAAGESLAPVISAYNGSLAERAVPEWRALLDALQALPEIGAAAPVGYAGMTLGTATGIMLAAAEPRIAAATLGGVFVYDALTEAARRVTIPLQVLLPWDDEEILRDTQLALYDAFASAEKTLHVNPGRHNQTPAFEVDDSARFLARHLRPAAAPAT